MNKKIGIAVHGGAGTILKSQMSPAVEKEYHDALEEALEAGYKILSQGGNAIDAVEASVRSLEDCPLFNAGKGSVFTHEGKHEMDASIMNGETLQAGAVACITGVRNPVSLARAVMEKSEHVILSGAGAEEFARKSGLELMPDEYFFNKYRYEQWQAAKDGDKSVLDHSAEKKFGTVGAVAVDREGNLAAATSTGGMTNKKWGRVGDTPLIGCGTFAENSSCAVSCTGHGEYFIRAVTAYDIACLIKYKGLSLRDACVEVVQNKLKQTGGEGGIIAINSSGEIVLEFNSEGMYRGSIDADGRKMIAIYK